MSAGQGSRPLPWHRASFLADLFPQSQPHRAALEVRQKTVPLFDLLQRLRRLQTGHLRLPCSNQHRPQGHSRFPPHPPFPDILKITDREEVKYTYAAIPSFVARGGGTIINIASIVAICPEILNGVYGGSKAFVLAFTQSLQHELGRKGMRIQAVLPGPTATGFFDVAGLPIEQLPSEIVMSSEDMVDAALAGLDQGEVVTIPGLHDKREWDRFDAARRAMAERAKRAVPAPRYNVV